SSVSSARNCHAGGASNFVAHKTQPLFAFASIAFAQDSRLTSSALLWPGPSEQVTPFALPHEVARESFARPVPFPRVAQGPQRNGFSPWISPSDSHPP